MYKNTLLSGQAPRVRVRVQICDTTDVVDTADVWQTLWELDEHESAYQEYHLLLDAFAGHRVRVAFQRHGKGGGDAYVDNVGVEVRQQPAIALTCPEYSFAGDTPSMAIRLTAGVMSNPQYEWYSTMAHQGQAMMMDTAGDTLKIAYLSNGLDTITATLTTDHGTATATAVVRVYACSPIDTFPWREGFENGIDCWTGNGRWSLSDHTVHSGSSSLSSYAQNNRTDIIVSPPILVPSDTHMLRLCLWGKRAGSYVDQSSPVSVLIADADCTDWSDATVLGTVIVYVGSYRYYELPLDAYAGRLVHFALRNTQNERVFVDDISIRYTREPVVGIATSLATVYGEDSITATATLVEGDTSGLGYQWHSTMAAEGLATILGSGQQVNIAYTGIGVDTIIATATNIYGTSTDTTMVRVCPKYDTLPYVADFANGFPCWQVLRGTCSVHSSGYLSFDGGHTTVATPPVWIPDDGNVVLEYDNAYSFFSGRTMVMVTTDMVHFDTLGNYPFTTGYHHSTIIPLNAYAGQYVRVIFTATGNFLQYYLTFVKIRYANEPVVQLEADDGHFPGTPMLLTASLREGHPANVTYRWASAMAGRGEATLTFDGGPQATLTGLVGGQDTVTVWVTNDYGTDSTWRVMNIKCSTMDTLPWEDDFSDRFLCWWQPEGSQWQVIDGVRDSASASVYNWTTVNDNWLVSRAIMLPEFTMTDGEVLQLWWDVGCQYQNRLTYSVLVTTGDYRDKDSYDTLAAFTSEVLPRFLEEWSSRHVDFTAYAGQTIHIAFRYNSNEYLPPNHTGLPGVLVIDNVRILDTRSPKVSIVQPEHCFVGDTVACQVQYIHGELSSMSYTWNSSLLDSTFYGDSNALVYPLSGVDTLTLVATNVYGSDTASATITVEAQPLPLLDASIPSMVLVQTPVSYRASVSECSPRGLAVTWHSTMLDSTFVQRDVFSSEWGITYDHGGIDTITVISSNIYGADTATKEVHINVDCHALPYAEHFERVTATPFLEEGYLPECWNYSWNGSSATYRPHVIANGHYCCPNILPSQALLMAAGSYGGLGDTVEVLLPRFANSLQTLSVAFDYRFEISNRGSLTVGYYDGNLFTTLQTMTPHDRTYRRDTVNFASATAPYERIVLRWIYSGSSYFAVVIDNIEVFRNGEMYDLRLSSADTAMGAVSEGGGYADGDTAVITATPAEGYHFVMWNDSVDANPRAVVMTSDTSFTAYFAPDTVWRRISVASADTLTGTVSGGGVYVDGDTAVITARPAEGYRFVMWNDSIDANPRAVVMTNDTSFTAYFAPDTVWHTVTIHARWRDSWEGDGEELDAYVAGAGTYRKGDTVTLSADSFSPKCPASLYGWVFVPGDTIMENPYSFVITSDTVVTAVYAQGVGITDVVGASFALYPNPASTEVMLDCGGDAEAIFIDLHGREVLRTRCREGKNRIDIGSLPAGVYYVRLAATSASATLKLVIQ